VEIVIAIGQKSFWDDRGLNVVFEKPQYNAARMSKLNTNFIFRGPSVIIILLLLHIGMWLNLNQVYANILVFSYTYSYKVIIMKINRYIYIYYTVLHLTDI